MLKNVASRRIVPALVVAAVATSLWACSGGSPNAANGANGANGQAANGASVPTAGPGLGTNPSSLSAAPVPTGASGGSVQLNDPANFPFVDPMQDRATDRFFNGQWGLNGGYIEQSQGARISSLTFRAYNGGTFGTANGVAPAHYRADVSAWVYQRADQYPQMVGAPLGILGYAPYFINESKYLLVTAKPKALEVWAVDGNQPGTEWPLANRLWKEDLATEIGVGAPVTWAVEIDTNAHTAKIWANGEEKATVTSGILTNAGQRVALVSNGNYVHYQDFKLFGL